MSDRSKAANKKRVQFWRYHIDTWSRGRDSPTGREIQNKPFGSARVISFPRIGGLNHVYKWDKAA